MQKIDEKTVPSIEAVVKAAAMHVPFEGWSHQCFDDAVRDSGVSTAEARALFPRGAVDVAVASHLLSDRALSLEIEQVDLDQMRVRERVTFLVRRRLELAGNPSVIRASCALFALPHLAPEGSKLIWNTSDLIWNLLSDPSRDINWYTKRATLSGVYGSTLLFYIGDQSEEYCDTWAFLDRRIENVMQIEKVKAQWRENPTMARLFKGPASILERVSAPTGAKRPFGNWFSQPRGY